MGRGFPDIFDKLYEDLSTDLPHEEDRMLLKTLLYALRMGGKKAVMDKVDEMVDDLVEKGQ